MDVRSCRGCGLLILSALLLTCTIVVVGTVALAAQQQPPASPHPRFGAGIFFFLYFAFAVYVTLFAVLVAAIEAGMVGSWRWIGGLVVATVVPLVVTVLPYPFLDLNTGFAVQQVGEAGMLIVPAATALAYSITRLIHPVARAPRT